MPNPPSPIPPTAAPSAPFRRAYAAYLVGLKWVVMALAGVAGAGTLAIILVTCADVILRKLGHPLPGALDLVTVLGTVTLACALPYTTAVKGHVAIEFLYHKLGRLGRILTDTFIRLLILAFFAAMSWQCFALGLTLKAKGQVTPTLKLPEFWVPCVIAFACVMMVLVTIHHLCHPGKEMIKP
jgi:TRAP-type C4-dicarboxylate transport system permease small subunit